MIRFSKYETYVHYNKKTPGDSLILDRAIWEKGREYFAKYPSESMVPVADERGNIICYAWQDTEANREIRMLRELEECREAIGFQKLYPEYACVTIHGFNELAWYMRQYLMQNGMSVNVEGDLWKFLGIEEGTESFGIRDYEIWAEGVNSKSSDWIQVRLKSASANFECVNQIYEANIKAGKIADNDFGVEGLLQMLSHEKEIIIRGTGTKAHDAYDWLLANNIHICAFQSGKANEVRKTLFGIPVLTKSQVKEQYKRAVIIECSARHSAWGFGGVDHYDYEGYERNKRYFLLRDYIDVPENKLLHIFKRKRLLLVGNIYLCNRVYKWYKKYAADIVEISYWDILNERKDLTEEDVVVVVAPQYAVEGVGRKETMNQCSYYRESLKKLGVWDYTDYFSDMMKYIQLETEKVKYPRKELRPGGIVLGAINAFSGNVLVRQCLSGHPQIVMIEGDNKGAFLDIELYYLCICLSEVKSSDLLEVFWELYQKESIEGSIERTFSNQERFDSKMRELLRFSDQFTSQELFVMFHLAFAAMHGREISNLEDVIIYWEPHCWDRNIVREWALWLNSADVRGYTLSTVRNRYILAGSAIRMLSERNWNTARYCIYGRPITNRKSYENWREKTIKFEELKCYPRETLTMLCEWLSISFDEILMETTYLGKKAYYGDITGFDVRPAYNLYEEYFSIFDRMRIAMASGSYQKKYGYPYVSCLEFSRRELQEMFLKDFRWEGLSGTAEREMDNYVYVQDMVRSLLWRERFAEVMQIDLDEEY